MTFSKYQGHPLLRHLHAGPHIVSTQVVAGLNYKFLCNYDDRTGTTGKCYVIIYQPLQGDPELTEIQKL